MFKNKNKAREEIKKDGLAILKITGMNIVLGLVIILVTQVIISREYAIVLDAETLPQSALAIFFNNVKVSLIYAVPYVGIIYYGIGFLFIYSVIGTYVHSYGYMMSVSHLWHLPLEVFALSIPIYVSLNYKKLGWNRSLCLIGLTIVLLFISAYVEFYVSKGVMM